MKTIKKLLDTDPKSGNTKVAKTGAKLSKLGKVRTASLSIFPDAIICPGSKSAGCMDGCLKSAGLASVYKSINQARQARTEYWHNNQTGFLDQLRRELGNFQKLCAKQNVQGVVRLNVLSDIAWEQHDIPQSFPGLFFYDYTKRSARLGKTPDNYRLMFSYSGRAQYRKQVLQAVCYDNPIAAVFANGEFPETFLGRPVVDGDQSDLWNVFAGRVVVGLKAKGPAKQDDSGFVVDLSEPIKFIAVA